MVDCWAVAPAVCRVFGWSQKPVLYWHLTQAFAAQLKQLMCLFRIVAGLWVYCKVSFYSLLLYCPVLCSRRCARRRYLLLFLLRLSTRTAPSLLCKLAQLDTLPSPPLQAARGQGQGQPLLFSSRPGHLFYRGAGGRNQGSKLPLLVREINI